VTKKSLYVRSNFKVNQTPQFKVLSGDQCEDVYLSALEVLERTGADILSKEGLGLFKNGGCWAEGERVHFPSSVVERAVKNVPSRIVISNRKGERALFLEAQNVYFGPGSGQNYVFDILTGERRAFQREDHEHTATVCDALPNIDFVAGKGACAFADLVKNTTKPIVQKASSVDQCRDIVNLAVAVAGSVEAVERKPFFIFQVESDSPLRGSAAALDQVIFAGKKRLPVIYSTRAFAGDGLPVTMAGALVMALADSLVGLVANQLAGCGAPFMMGGLLSALDLDNGSQSCGAPEHGLLSSAFVDVCRYLQIPNFSMGGCTDSPVLDAQGSVETAFSVLSSGLSGANLIQGCNVMESGNTASLDLLVMNDEIIGMVKRILKGIPVDDDTMAVDVIDEVGPGGHFLGSEHTILNFRSQTWWPTIINRNRYDDWTGAGKKTLAQRVNEKTRGILNNHQPEPLSQDTLAKINEILSKIEYKD